MCYCKTAGGSLDASIKEAKAKVESLGAALKSGGEKKAQTEADLKEHQASRSEAKEAMSQATALREKEAVAFAAYEQESKTNIAALSKAIPAIEHGMSSAFLQTEDASMLRRFAMEKAELTDETRQEVLAFLSGTDSEEYIPQSGQIVGILKEMEDEMSKGLADATSAEAEAVKSYEALLAAKQKEVDALTVQIEEEQTRIGDLGVELAMITNDLEDTEESLGQDSKFLSELGEGCSKKEKEWDEIKTTRQEELVALSETIKTINEDEALELFKKTLPSAASSFIQIKISMDSVRARALVAIREAALHQKILPPRPEINLIALALRGKKIGFEKLVSMIDEMVANLNKEQVDDESKKEYCDAQLDIADDKKKELELSVSDSETAIDEMKGSIASVIEEIAALEEGIKALDKSVAEATENRKEENADYKELKANDSSAKEILMFAKNRLNKFYNPKLYTAPPAAEEASFIQISSHFSGNAVPPPPPETFGPYTKKTEGSAGVISMIDLLVKDLDKELTEAEVMEEDAQKEYETMMAESALKRADDAKSISDKTSAKAALEEALEGEEDKKAGTAKELMGTYEYIQSLHGECDWFLKFFEARKEARSGEIDALGKAKAVLGGADYSLVQTSNSARATQFLAPSAN